MEHWDQRSDEQALDEQERAVAIRLLRTIVIVVLIASAAVLVADGIVGGVTSTIVALLPLSLLMLISLYLLGRKILWLSLIHI